MWEFPKRCPLFLLFQVQLPGSERSMNFDSEHLHQPEVKVKRTLNQRRGAMATDELKAQQKELICILTYAYFIECDLVLSSTE